MATVKKVKKAQSGYSTTAKAVDSLRAVGAKQLGTPEGTKTLGRLKAAEAKERKEDAIKMKSMKMSGSIKKAQKGKKLPSGASSASAESDYAKSDSLRNVANKMTGKDFFENARLKKPSPRIQSDSLKMEGDRKTKATGGVPRDYRFKMGGKMSKMMSKMKSKMSKKK